MQYSYIHIRLLANALPEVFRHEMNAVRSQARSLILAIDQGTTSTRCLAFDSRGFVAYNSVLEFPQIYPNAGWVEHDPEAIFGSVLSCIANLQLKPDDAISAVGITNQRETIVAWDRYTGEPLHNAIVWLDSRTSDMVATVAATSPLGVNKYREITGLPLSTYFSSLKIRWLIDNVHRVSAAVKAKSCCFGSIDSYLTYRLTGCKIHVTDCTNASRYNLMDISRLEWSTEVCEDLGIPIESLPRIISNSEMVGAIDGSIVSRLSGVPITSLIGDQHAALLGHGCVEKGRCKITYGTGCFLLMNSGEERIESKSGGLLTTLGYQLGPEAKPIFALEGSVASAGRSLEWAKTNLRIGENLKEFNEIASSVPDTVGVTFVPAFSGLFAPYWRPDARAVIVGMSLRSNYRHIARAILEATAVQCAEVTKLIESDGDISINSIVTDGGMTKSDLLMKIQADLLAKTVLRAKMTESTAFGAAYAAGLAINFWGEQTLSSILSNVGGHDVFSPTMSSLERDRIFERWEDAVARSLNMSQFV